MERLLTLSIRSYSPNQIIINGDVRRCMGSPVPILTVFSEVWEQIEPKIEGLPLVAHNASFDRSCLMASFHTYQMDYPDYEFFDTLEAARHHFPHLPNHQLHTVSSACGFELIHHHHALADAEACAWIAREIL